MMKHIAILLTTYNSALFLDELLKSILNQTYINWTLYIRDDGSDDSTLKIIQAYLTEYKKILYLDDPVKHRGPKNGFMWMLEQPIDADFYMFCDHDDVWLNNKIELTLQNMMSLGDKVDKIPVIVHTDLSVTDKDLNILKPSLWETYPMDADVLSNDLCFHYVYNNVTGCTMMLNHKAREAAFPVSVFAYMHDAWIALAVLAKGGMISCVHKPTILYRQHLNNTLGTRKLPSLWMQLKDLKNILKRTMLQYKTVNTLEKVSLLRFWMIKLKYNLMVRFRSGN